MKKAENPRKCDAGRSEFPFTRCAASDMNITPGLFPGVGEPPNEQTLLGGTSCSVDIVGGPNAESAISGNPPFPFQEGGLLRRKISQREFYYPSFSQISDFAPLGT